MKKKLENLDISELNTLYGIVNEICGEYSRMTDGYSLATGDNKFESIPEEVREMINNRQRFISYKLKLKNVLIDKIIKEMEQYE